MPPGFFPLATARVAYDARAHVKILLSTFSCGPNSVSEPGIGWRAVCHALSRNHEVWAVIEAVGYEEPVTNYLRENPMPGFHPVFLKLPPIFARTLRQGSAIAGNVYYNIWQQKLIRVARELHRKIGFDLAHHVTFGRCWAPSGLRELDLPFIWGPVGAAERAPASFVSELPLRARLEEGFRTGIQTLSYFDPALKKTAKAATIGIGTTRESCQALRDLGVRQVEQLPQIAVRDDDLDFFGRIPLLPVGAPFRVICMGRLLYWKGFHLAVRAFALFAKNHPDAELWIVHPGGAFQREIEKTVAKTGMQRQVRFFTNLPNYAAVMDKLAHAHVLLHPALREGFGAVCSEAMAAGRPVICLDLAGPAVQVTPKTGFAVPATTPDEAVATMASILAKLQQDRPLLEKLSVQGRARVRKEFTVRALEDAIDSIYDRAITLHAEEHDRKAAH
jgi:glycosyltransferase involved in cell wall biosynthesis